MKKVYRYIIPVDDRLHRVQLTSDPLFVGGQIDYVEFWAEYDEDTEGTGRYFRVYGTGHEVPNRLKYVGTAPRNDYGLVWHLYEDFGNE